MNNVIESLYELYLDGHHPVLYGLDAELDRISGIMEDKLKAEALTCGDLGDYQAVAEHKAYYAGFLTAMDLFNGR